MFEKFYGKDEITVRVMNRRDDVDPKYAQQSCVIRFGEIRKDFLAGKPVPKGIAIFYMGHEYQPGDRLASARGAAHPGNAERAQKAQEAPLAALAADKVSLSTPADDAARAAFQGFCEAPSLDMFDNTDPNAPRTMDQNNAFWGLMEKLAKVTGKTAEEMKTILVARALGESKGTSKLTIAEMDKVIRYVKATLALFTEREEAKANA